MAVKCEMIVGFLTPHRCASKAVTTCAKCGRRFCDEHVGIIPAGLICTACQQGLEQPVAVAQTARTFDADDMTVFSSGSAFDDDDAISTFDDNDDMFADLS